MLDTLIQQFAGGEAQSMEGGELHGGVAQLAENAPSEHTGGAFGEALGALGAGGFGQSVQQGVANAGPGERAGLLGMLTQAIDSGGGSSGNVMSDLGIDASNPSSQGLGALAAHVAENHPDALSGIFSGAMGGGSGGGGSGILKLLGNPMVRQVGMQLAQKMM